MRPCTAPVFSQPVHRATWLEHGNHGPEHGDAPETWDPSSFNFFLFSDLNTPFFTMLIIFLQCVHVPPWFFSVWLKTKINNQPVPGAMVWSMVMHLEHGDAHWNGSLYSFLFSNLNALFYFSGLNNLLFIV